VHAITDTSQSASPRPESRRGSPRSIRHRTEHLTGISRVLYGIEHYTSLAGVAAGIVVVFLCLIVVGAILGFPPGWLTAFEVSISTLTLVFVVSIQHTQAREQIATQRKLDELLHAAPGASDDLIMLEEAPAGVIQDVEAGQRDARDRSA
jgi:low affinity Fe/Cu permease